MCSVKNGTRSESRSFIYLSVRWHGWRKRAGGGLVRPSARAASTAASSVRVDELPATLVCELGPSDTLLVYGVP